MRGPALGVLAVVVFGASAGQAIAQGGDDLGNLDKRLSNLAQVTAPGLITPSEPVLRQPPIPGMLRPYNVCFLQVRVAPEVPDLLALEARHPLVTDPGNFVRELADETTRPFLADLSEEALQRLRKRAEQSLAEDLAPEASGGVQIRTSIGLSYQPGCQRFPEGLDQLEWVIEVSQPVLAWRAGNACGQMTMLSGFGTLRTRHVRKFNPASSFSLTVPFIDLSATEQALGMAMSSALPSRRAGAVDFQIMVLRNYTISVRRPGTSGGQVVDRGSYARHIKGVLREDSDRQSRAVDSLSDRSGRYRFGAPGDQPPQTDPAGFSPGACSPGQMAAVPFPVGLEPPPRPQPPEPKTAALPPGAAPGAGPEPGPGGGPSPVPPAPGGFPPGGVPPSGAGAGGVLTPQPPGNDPFKGQEEIEQTDLEDLDKLKPGRGGGATTPAGSKPSAGSAPKPVPPKIPESAIPPPDQD